jgi:TPR repeat protein
MDKMAAAAAYDAGCRAGADKASCARYAVLQMQGLGVQRDSTAALATLEHLCGEKVDDACIGWALILAGRTEKRDVPKARALLQAPCDGGNGEACRILKSMPPR